MNERLQSIYSIGPELAKLLVGKLLEAGFISENDIKNNTKNERDLRRILKKRKIFDTLPVAAKVDLTYHPIKDIPRDIIHIIDGELQKYLRGVKFTIAGSYLRGKLVSHDIDLVLSKGRIGVQVFDRMVNAINDHSRTLYIYNPYARGEDKVTTLFEVLVPPDLRYLPLLKKKMTTTKKVRVKVDVFLCEPTDYMFTLLFATGSGLFNVRMRSLAKHKGYLLNQRGLYKILGEKKKKIPIKTEEQLFKLLGMQYRTPEERSL
jgi:DNA polymerase/3'-5' exonuclease PolX